MIPYFDKFPAIDKDKLIDDVMKNMNEFAVSVFMKNKDKLEFSTRELIDLFIKYKKLDYICFYTRTIIDEKYHQEILDRIMQDYDPINIINNSDHFKQVNVQDFLVKMFKEKSDDIADMINHLSSNWLVQMQPEFVDEIVKVIQSKL